MQSSMTFADRALLWFFMLAISLIAVRAYRVAEWPVLISVNVVCLGLITVFIAMRRRNEFWRFVHDWYPMAMFIVCFEEVSRSVVCNSRRLAGPFPAGARSQAVRGAADGLAWTARFGVDNGSPGDWIFFVFCFTDDCRRNALSESGPAKVSPRDGCDRAGLYVLLRGIRSFSTEGPAHTLASSHLSPLPGGGPFHWMVGLIQRNAGVHGNAFPSAHVAGAVVAVYFAWQYLPRVRWVLTALVCLLCVGAVYDRYHYVSDVVAGALVGLGAAFWITIASRNEAPSTNVVDGDVWPDPRGDHGDNV